MVVFSPFVEFVSGFSEGGLCSVLIGISVLQLAVGIEEFEKGGCESTWRQGVGHFDEGGWEGVDDGNVEERDDEQREELQFRVLTVVSWGVEMDVDGVLDAFLSRNSLNHEQSILSEVEFKIWSFGRNTSDNEGNSRRLFSNQLLELLK